MFSRQKLVILILYPLILSFFDNPPSGPIRGGLAPKCEATSGIGPFLAQCVPFSNVEATACRCEGRRRVRCRLVTGPITVPYLDLG